MKSVLLIHEPDSNDRLFSAYSEASTAVRKALISTKGGVQAENRYSSTYQDLAKQGLVQQIKKKYR